MTVIVSFVHTEAVDHDGQGGRTLRVLKALTAGRAVRTAAALSVAGLVAIGLAGSAVATEGYPAELKGQHKNTTATYPEFTDGNETCPDSFDDNVDVWHFVLPSGGGLPDADFLSLTVEFNPGGEQTIEPNAKDAYVASPVGATLVDATALVSEDMGEFNEFNVSHTCPGTVPEPEPEPIPGVTGTEVCATNEDGESGLEITLTNSGNANATFNVEGVGPVVVGPDKSETIFIPIGEDEPYDVEVTEETTGTTWGFKGTLNCEEPEPAPGPGAGFTESCVDGGVIVYLDNIGEADAVFTVEALVNGEPLEPISETVPPSEATESVLELESGDAYEIVVTDETTFFAFVDGTFECVEEEPSTGPTTGPSPAPGERGGALPKTGAGFPTATAAWLGVFLLATGGFLLTWRRGMLPIPYRRKD